VQYKPNLPCDSVLIDQLKDRILELEKVVAIQDWLIAQLKKDASENKNTVTKK